MQNHLKFELLQYLLKLEAAGNCLNQEWLAGGENIPDQRVKRA
jgi:hypothetical protein